MDGEQRRGSGGASTPASPSLTKRRGSRKRLKPSLIRIDYLIPLVQDEPPRRQHPHTAYAEWDRILWENGIFRPTKHLGLEEGSEGWGKPVEKSRHWWVGVSNEAEVQLLLDLLGTEATRIFHQRWIIAGRGDQLYELKAPRRRRR